MSSKTPFLPAAALALSFAACDFMPQSAPSEGDPAAASSPTRDVSAEDADLSPAGARVIDDADGEALAKLSGDPILWKTDLEDQTSTCWGVRNTSGYATVPCGEWGGMGTFGAKLAENGVRRSGSKSMSFTYTKNEDVAGAGLTLSANLVNVRAWYYFAPRYDFRHGI